MRISKQFWLPRSVRKALFEQELREMRLRRAKPPLKLMTAEQKEQMIQKIRNQKETAAGRASAVSLPITVHSRWIRKQIPIEVEVVRVTFFEVSFLAPSFSATLPRSLFLQGFQPVTERKKEER